MEKALALAEKGRGTVSPNPMVGAVVVRDGTVVGRGWHRKAGGDHAEVIALGEAGEAARGATLYVTLEPCCHYGKTPPCTDAIVRAGVRRVVAAMMDDNPNVCGNGCAELARNGIEIVVGVCENRARRLNEAFLKWIGTGRPFVTLKLAATLDGRIADRDGKSVWITGPEARKHVHLMRAWSDAVMVGIGTVLADNPALTVRDVPGKNPLRIVVDSRLRAPLDAKVFADGDVLVVSTEEAERALPALFENSGIEMVELPARDGRVELGALLDMLGKRDVTSVLCEGGASLATSLLRERLVDKVVFVTAPKILGGGLPSVGDIGIESIDRALKLRDSTVEIFGNDVFVSGYPDYDASFGKKS